MASDWGPGVSVSPVENLTTDTLSNFVVEVNGDTSFLHIDGSTLPPTLSLDNVASIEQTVIVVGACLQILHNRRQNSANSPVFVNSRTCVNRKEGVTVFL